LNLNDNFSNADRVSGEEARACPQTGGQIARIRDDSVAKMMTIESNKVPQGLAGEFRP